MSHGELRLMYHCRFLSGMALSIELILQNERFVSPPGRKTE